MGNAEGGGGEFVATLIHESDYAKQVNQVAILWTDRLRFIRRKELAIEPYAVEEVPMARIKAISYRMSYSVAPALLGVVCIAALAAVLVLPIPFGTRVPVGALMLAAGGGLVWLRGMKRHVLEFAVDGKVLSWRSKAGEFKDREVIVQKVLSFARGAGLFRESPGET